MRVGTVAIAVALLGLTVEASWAQVLSLEFHDGRVKLTAENVPVSRILAEWTRVGGTRIVNGDRVPGAPVSLLLVDTPEEQAIDIILRGAAGYMVAGRAPVPAGASVFDRILVLPTSSPAPSAPAPQPIAPPIERQEDPNDADQPDTPQRAPVRPQGFPGARVPVNAPPQNPRPQEAEPDTNTPPPAVAAPGNPFGVIPGSTRPGTITPVTPPRGPNDPRQR